ncbi:hypothetical protein KY359_05225 [Candidatus Woesearchaeota archaeon]|nr:hypothetical protein [Candidatus Woesearchaeota archaeon]
MASCASVEKGGLATALAKVSVAGGLGMEVDVQKMDEAEVVYNVHNLDHLLFSESQGRFVVTVDPKKKVEFERQFDGASLCCVGRVTENKDFVVKYGPSEEFIRTTVDDMAESYNAPLRGY